MAFEDKHLNTIVGTIVRINQRTASIVPGDGTTWRVGFALLRHVVDIRLARGLAKRAFKPRLQQPRGQYTQEFKLEAVRLVKTGQSVGVTAKVLGIPKARLSNWVRSSERGQLGGAGDR